MPMTMDDLTMLRPSDIERIRVSISEEPEARKQVMKALRDYLRCYVKDHMRDDDTNAAYADEVYVTLSKLAAAGVFERDKDGGFTIDLEDEDLAGEDEATLALERSRQNRLNRTMSSGRLYHRDGHLMVRMARG